jgi:hypothetical protein
MEWTEGFLTGGQTTVRWSDPHLVVVIGIGYQFLVLRSAACWIALSRPRMMEAFP